MGEQIRLLVVSEDDAGAEPAAAALCRTGFDPEWRRVGSEAALAAALDASFEVILARVDVPALDPGRILELVRAAGLDLPVIAMAPAIAADELAALFRQGVTDYASLPGLERLPAAVAEARGARATRAEARRRDAATAAAAAETRRRADEGFRLLFASSPLPMWVYDIETLYFLEVNDAAVRHYGYWRHEFLRMRATDIRPPDEAARFERRVAQFKAESQQTVRRSSPWPHRMKDGRIRQMDTAGHAIDFGGRRAMLVVAMDITEVLEAQETAARNHARLRILHDIDRAIIAADEPSAAAEATLRSLRDLLRVPRAAIGMFDWAAGEIQWLATVGRRRVHIGPGPRFPLSLMGDIAALRRGEIQMLDTAGLTRGPDTEALLASGVLYYSAIPMIADGELLGVLSFGGDTADFSDEQIGIAREAATQIAVLLSQARLRERLERQSEELERRVAERTAELSATNARLQREIAERRRAEEEASHANRAKSEFLSRMSHELRTPLNGILGFAQLLEMDARDPHEQESVSHILKGGRHLLALIDEVLDISRIEAGRLPISLEPVLIGDTVRTAVDLVRPQAAACGVTLGNEAGDDERHVTADRQRLQQVLLNLLSNAVKYNRKGGTVTVSSAARPGGRIAIAVADTGTGIPESMLDRLFTPFDRLGAEQSEVQGTGLGLALSRRLVEAMGGQLLVQSRPGVGSTFSVELPAAEAPGRSATGVDTPMGDAGRGRGTILYIEDNVANLRLVQRIVERRPGLTLLSAMQGSQGLDLARAHRPQMILLDLHLPDLHGEEVLARLQDDPLTREIPVVIVSADAVPGDVSRLLARGARSYVTKPLEVAALLALLDEVLAET